jgi:hypothetical protein
VRRLCTALPTLLLAAGAAVLVTAVAWWWTTFGDIVGYGYLSWTEAGRCLVHDSDICALAKTLCLGSHPRSLVAYWTSAFWLGLGVVSIGLLAPQMHREVR